MKNSLSRKRARPLGLKELIAIALGGMVGGGIFSILGLSVEHVGNMTPLAIIIGGLLALAAAYSYVKLALLYQDEGATYAFFKKTYPQAGFAKAAIGWLVCFGYISTLALYAYTFSSYFCTAFSLSDHDWLRKLVAGVIILSFVWVNLKSVRGMGKLEDLMVFIKIVLMLIISGFLAGKGDLQQVWPLRTDETSWTSILMMAAVTFVAFEGFQLVIHAHREMDAPKRNTPRAIYSAIAIATVLYVVLAVGALAAIPQAEIIAGKEYALAAGSASVLGNLGYFMVIFGALLATSSAISGTLFGASRLMAVIADDGYFPKTLKVRSHGHIPRNALWAMFVLSYLLIMIGGLQLIVEFGSVTFIIVSLLMAVANFKKRHQTGSHTFITLLAMISLSLAGIMILVFEWQHAPHQLLFIVAVYIVLLMGAFLQSKQG